MPREWIHWQGQTINQRFELTEYLGGSEDTAVFLTNLDSSHPQKAAIKLFRLGTTKAELQLSLWASVKKLSHPHLIRLFEAGEYSAGEEHGLYVLMEYAEENLSTILPSRPLTPEEVSEMLNPMLDALAYIHGQGLVHGHIKPANIMAVGEQLKISSDGIAPPEQLTHHLAKASYYLPREAANGRLSKATDSWSLGATLIEALTQQKPALENDGEGQAALSRLPAPFRNIAEQCLRPDPQQRYTVSDIQRELRSPPSSTHHPVEGGPATKVRTNRRLASIATAALLSILVAAVMLSRHHRPPDGSAPTPQAQVSPLPPARTEVADSVAVGKVARQVLPEVSKSSLATIHGTIRVKVRVDVDSSGSVGRARVEAGGPSRYFADKALAAAKQWKFGPPVANSKSVPSEWRLEFQFKRTGTLAQAVKLSP
jgi:TonB family protein